MGFPKSVSFALTNACNSRCRMCGQWSRNGYMHTMKERLKNEIALSDWKIHVGMYGLRG
jgi:MoaA/NifB/PqqE/SkfB family radical SAM enzyme